MFEIIIHYILIGIAVNFVFDWLGGKYRDREWTIGERLYLLLTWPFTLIIFIMEFISILIYGRRDDEDDGEDPSS